ncbi:MAG TPA: hypothetical protein VGG71_01745, partial [Chitinophagaceae bacterium]
MNDPYKWLTDFLSVRERTSPLSLEYIIPGVFERYFFLHFNYGIIDDFPFDDYPEGKTDISDINKRVEIERRYGLFLRSRWSESMLKPVTMEELKMGLYPDQEQRLYRAITLKELAATFHTAHSVEMLYEMKDTPGIAPLIKRTLENVGKFIQHVQNEDSLCLYVVDYYRFSFGEQIGEDKSVKEKN